MLQSYGLAKDEKEDDKLKYEKQSHYVRKNLCKHGDDGWHFYNLVTPEFFTFYYSENNLSGPIIHLGACTGFGDNKDYQNHYLSTALLNVGGSAVVGHVNSVYTIYDLYVLAEELDNLFSNKPIDDALTAAEDKFCDNDKDFMLKYGNDEMKKKAKNHIPAYNSIHGNTFAKLNFDIREYTAEELATKTLSEIVDILGEDFEVGFNDDKLIYYTSPSVHIYNYDVLPGFVFYIYGASEDYEKGQDVKANIKSGKYDSYAFIAMLDNAKLTDEIYANMTYNELTNIIGVFDCGGLAGAGNYSYYTDKVGKQTIYMFDADESLLNSYNGGDIKKNWLKEHNPKLSAIIVYPESDDDSQESNIESETSGIDDNWKQLYIDMISDDIDPNSFSLIKIDNDDIPELIFTGSAVGGTRMAWVKDGKLKIQAIGYGEVQYYEKQGIFYCQYVNHGIFEDSVYKMDNHSISTVFQGTILPKENGFDNPGWFIDNESVNESVYISKLNSAFDFSNAKKMDTYYTRSEITDVINNF